MKLMSMLKKLVASFLVFVVLFANTVGSVSAVGEWYNQTYQEWSKKVHGGEPNQIFGERYTAAQVRWVMYGLLNLFSIHPLPEIFACEAGNFVEFTACATIVLGEEGVGLLVADTAPSEKSDESLAQAVFSERPISTISYFKDIGRNLKLIPEANAQTTGFGFTALNPILELWKAARNLCYALLVIVIVVMSFMIMFKVKINPQTVITVQSAIPKVVIALILITFSYAIAGLLVDLMYVVFGLLGLALTPIYDDPLTSFNMMTKGQPFGGDINLGVWGLFLFYFLYFIISTAVVIIGTLGIAGATGIGLLAATIGVVTAGIGPIIAIVLIAIVFIIMIVAMIKTVWALIKATAGVLLLTVVGPLQILLGTVIPNFGFTAWLRSFVANLATFVTIGFLFQLCIVFLNAAWTALFPDLGKGLSQLFFGTDPIIHPGEFTERGWPPLLGTGDGAVPTIFLGVSFALFTMIPKAADIVQAFIKGQQFNYGAALNEATVQPFKTAFNIGATISKAGEIYRMEKGRQSGGIEAPGSATSTRGTNIPGGRAVIPPTR